VNAPNVHVFDHCECENSHVFNHYKCFAILASGAVCLSTPRQQLNLGSTVCKSVYSRVA